QSRTRFLCRSRLIHTTSRVTQKPCQYPLRLVLWRTRGTVSGIEFVSATVTWSRARRTTTWFRLTIRVVPTRGDGAPTPRKQAQLRNDGTASSNQPDGGDRTVWQNHKTS